jgi:hypothetical protein
MVIDFLPQFHKRILQNDGHNAWVAMPLPDTLIPAKARYYRAWRRAERLRLQEAGERVHAPVPSRGSKAEDEYGLIMRRKDIGASSCVYC